MTAPGLCRFGGMLWTPVRVRQIHPCWLSGDRIDKGDIAYRPITNGGDRMRRISQDAMHRALNRPTLEASQ